MVLTIAPESVTWRRVIDLNDKGLAHVITGLDDVPQAPRRETGFDLTAASEVMAIFCLATSLKDLKERLGNIVFGYTRDGKAAILKGAKATPEEQEKFNVIDQVYPLPRWENLPPADVFRAFERLSYGLVLREEQPLAVLDEVRNP